MIRERAAGKELFLDPVKEHPPPSPEAIIVTAVSGAIDRRRQRVGQEITTESNKGWAAYPLEAAIRDALVYHGQCSAVASLAEISTLIGDAPPGGEYSTLEFIPPAPSSREETRQPINTKENMR